jgi:3-oxoacyl-[acyl-carrier protein] reductase
MHNVLVTGGSRGIGLAIARRLAGAGYNVIAVARRESEQLHEATRAIVQQEKGGLRFKSFDLSEIDGIPAFVKRLREEFGAIYGSSTMPASAPRGCLRRCTTAKSRRWCASTCCRR